MGALTIGSIQIGLDLIGTRARRATKRSLAHFLQ